MKRPAHCALKAQQRASKNRAHRRCPCRQRSIEWTSFIRKSDAGTPMTKFQFHDDCDAPIDAHFEVQSGELILHSRGGTIGSASARNTQYGPALRLLLERIESSELVLAGVWVDSSVARKLPISQRRIFFLEDTGISPEELSKRLSKRMASVGQDSDTRRCRGNSTKRLRFAFGGNPSDEGIMRVAGWGERRARSNQDGRLSVATFDRVSEDHIWRAVEQLVSGRVKHSFGESTHYDVIADDGSRLPPKAVFGVAASDALGVEVEPRHFMGGLNSRCFKAITEAGYPIVRKGDDVPPDEAPQDPKERKWVEGRLGFVTHLHRERARGLAQTKKRAFRREHGRLYCERCGLEPEGIYGCDAGEACIEVHHKQPLDGGTTVRMTRLKDLMCVCANCHRIIHYELRRKV